MAQASGNDKRPGSRGFKKLSEFGNVSLQGGTKASKTYVLLCFSAIREGRRIGDRSLLTSSNLDFAGLVSFPESPTQTKFSQMTPSSLSWAVCYILARFSEGREAGGSVRGEEESLT